MLFSFTVRMMLAAIFFTSALPKLRNPRAFASVLEAYRLLSTTGVRPLAYTLPWLEVVLGLLLFLGWGARIAAVASVGLLILYLAAMGLNLRRGRTDLDCGCSGKQHAQKISWKTILRNFVYILLLIPVAVSGGGYLSIDHLSLTARTFILETLLLHSLLPLALSVAGVWLLTQLFQQILRLVMLVPVENQARGFTENFRSGNSPQAEKQK